MRVLVIRVNSYKKTKPDFLHPVDFWRVVSPLQEIQKHTDWTVDYVTDWTFNFANMADTIRHIGMHYDLIVTSYNITNPEAYAWLKVLQSHYGVKHVLDIDDDLYNIDETNPTIETVWHQGNIVSKHHFMFDTIVRDAANISVSTNTLGDLYQKKRKKHPKTSITILPNKINLAIYSPHKRQNDGKIVIGYFGGVSHHGDLHNTGFLAALKTVLKRYPEVKFECIGMPVVNFKLPKNQFKFYPGPNQGGPEWGKFLSGFSWDICVAPLADTVFNNAKSDIKWQESTAIGCPVVASFKRPYIKAIVHEKTGLLAKDEADWVKYLSLLVDNAKLRQEIASNAYQEVLKHHSLEQNYQQWQEYYERIVSD